MKRNNTVKRKRVQAEQHQLRDIIRAVKLRFSRLRAKLAVRAIRNRSRKSGLDKMTSEDINKLIRDTREYQKA